MEVHHPHHPTHKKKWSEYIIEFVMLFTAVTLGFFAENIREHLAENEKKNELLKSVSTDLKRDINQLAFHKDFDLNKIKVCDSLIDLLKKDPSKVDQQEYYRLLGNVVMYWHFISNNRSRNDAESKGYLSIKENSELAKYISKYNFFLFDLEDVTNTFGRMSEKISMEKMKYMVDADIYDRAVKFPPAEIPHKFGINKIDQDALKEYRLFLTDTKFGFQIALYNIDSLQFYANKAVEFIDKEYGKE
jgi:hypothetical protein